MNDCSGGYGPTYNPVKRGDDFEGCTTFEEMAKTDLIKLIDLLFTSLDNIDTISDMAKGNDQAYRSMVEKEVVSRWKWISSDGYGIRPKKDIGTATTKR